MKNALLLLVRLGIGTSKDVEISKGIDWESVETLADRQGVLGVMYDAVERLKTYKDIHAEHEAASQEIPTKGRNEALPSQITWLRWTGKVIQGYEQRYVLYRKAVADLGLWYQTHGYRMMVLKGLACGINWPRPEHRPYGDIDIYLFGQYKEADALMVQEFKDQGFKVDNSHHHHTVYQWQGFIVENHYDFLNVHHHKSMVEMERVLKGIVGIPHQVRNENLKGGELANFHALFLLRHAMTHFAAKEITLRHLLDWGFYAKTKGSEINWEWLVETIERFGMRKLFDVFNAICVEDLGFDKTLFPQAELDAASQEIPGQDWVDGTLKERVLNDILSPEFDEKAPKGIIRRSIFKYRRWKANGWKHELCYNESMKSAFWSGVKLHLMKPSSI